MKSKTKLLVSTLFVVALGLSPIAAKASPWLLDVSPDYLPYGYHYFCNYKLGDVRITRTTTQAWSDTVKQITLVVSPAQSSPVVYGGQTVSEGVVRASWSVYSRTVEVTPDGVRYGDPRILGTFYGPKDVVGFSYKGDASALAAILDSYGMDAVTSKPSDSGDAITGVAVVQPMDAYKYVRDHRPLARGVNGFSASGNSLLFAPTVSADPLPPAPIELPSPFWKDDLLLSGWTWGWMGYVWTDEIDQPWNRNWVYSLNHGWIYFLLQADVDQPFTAWTAELGWVHVGKQTYPWAFRYDTRQWVNLRPQN